MGKVLSKGSLAGSDLLMQDYSRLNSPKESHSDSKWDRENLKDIGKSLANMVTVIVPMLALQKILDSENQSYNAVAFQVFKVFIPILIFFTYLGFHIYGRKASEKINPKSNAIKNAYELKPADEKIVKSPKQELKKLKGLLIYLQTQLESGQNIQVPENSLLPVDFDQLSAIKNLLSKENYQIFKYHKTKLGFLHYALNFSLAFLSALAIGYMVNRGSYNIVDKNGSFLVIQPFENNALDIISLALSSVFGGIASLAITKETAQSIIDNYEKYNSSINVIEENVNEVRELGNGVLELIKAKNSERMMKKEDENPFSSLSLLFFSEWRKVINDLTDADIDVKDYELIIAGGIKK